MFSPPCPQVRETCKHGRAILECKMVSPALNVESVLRQKGTEVTTIAPEATVKRATDWLLAKNIGSLVVTSVNSILGVISEREIVHALSQFGEQVAPMAVKDIMRPRLLPRRERSLQRVENDLEGRDRPRGLGHPAQRYVPPHSTSRGRAASLSR
jgi:predicted transcriptional regulator